MPEEECVKYMKVMFQTICHMHAQKFAHRDIKFENIMLTKDNQIKLIDFGLAKRMKDQHELNDAVGTPYFVAPEILKGQHDIRCDLWSLGVLLYSFLSGKKPFDGEEMSDLLVKIKKGKFNFRYPAFNNVSEDAKDLIRKLLKVEPDDRISAKDALQHVWFKNMGH